MAKKNLRKYVCRNEILTTEPRDKSLQDFAGLIVSYGGEYKDLNNELLMADMEIPSFEQPSEDTGLLIESAMKRDDICAYLREKYISDCNICHVCACSDNFSNDNIGLERQIIMTLLHTNIRSALQFFPSDPTARTAFEEKFRAYANLNEGRGSIPTKPFYVPIYKLMYRMLCEVIDTVHFGKNDVIGSVGIDVLTQKWNDTNPKFAINEYLLEEYPNAKDIFVNEVNYVLGSNGKMTVSDDNFVSFFNETAPVETIPATVPVEAADCPHNDEHIETSAGQQEKVNIEADSKESELEENAVAQEAQPDATMPVHETETTSKEISPASTPKGGRDVKRFFSSISERLHRTPGKEDPHETTDEEVSMPGDCVCTSDSDSNSVSEDTGAEITEKPVTVSYEELLALAIDGEPQNKCEEEEAAYIEQESVGTPLTDTVSTADTDKTSSDESLDEDFIIGEPTVNGSTQEAALITVDADLEESLVERDERPEETETVMPIEENNEVVNNLEAEMFSDDDALFGDDDFLFSEEDFDTEEDTAVANDNVCEVQSPACEQAEVPTAEQPDSKETSHPIIKLNIPKKKETTPDFHLFAFPTISQEDARKYTLPANAKRREQFATALINACVKNISVAIEAAAVATSNTVGLLAWPVSFTAPVFVPATDEKGLKMLSGIVKDSGSKKVTFNPFSLYYFCQQNLLTIRNLVSATDYRDAVIGPSDALDRMSSYRDHINDIGDTFDENEKYLERAYSRLLYAREGKTYQPLFTFANERFVFDRYEADSRHMYINVNVNNVSLAEWHKSVNDLMITLEKHGSFDKHSARLCYLDYERLLMVFEVERRDARSFSSVIGRQFLRILEVNSIDVPTCLLTQNSKFLK